MAARPALTESVPLESYAAAGHYQNLEGPFSQVGCGVYIANQRITLIQDFR